MKFAHISDIHLSEKLSLQSEITQTVRNLIWKSFEDCLESLKDVDFLIISGDLYEKDFFSVSDYQRLFEIFEKFSSNIYYVAGNHDPYDLKAQMFFKMKPDNLYIFPTNRVDYFEQKNVRIYGISYEDRIFNRRFNYNISLNHDYKNILVLHSDVYNDGNYLKIDLDRLRQMQFDYVALGHIHKRDAFEGNMFYAGSIEPMSFKDKYSYGYNFIDDFHVKHVDSSIMQFVTLNFDFKEDNFEKIYKILDKELFKEFKFLRLNIRNSDECQLRQLKEIKRVYDLVHLEINSTKDKDLDYQTLKSLYRGSILEDYVNAFSSKDKISTMALELGMDALLRSRDE